jgi:hypothetical protein
VVVAFVLALVLLPLTQVVPPSVVLVGVALYVVLWAGGQVRSL